MTPLNGGHRGAHTGGVPIRIPMLSTALVVLMVSSLVTLPATLQDDENTWKSSSAVLTLAVIGWAAFAAGGLDQLRLVHSASDSWRLWSLLFVGAVACGLAGAPPTVLLSVEGVVVLSYVALIAWRHKDSHRA